MPCLNEKKTIEICINKAFNFLKNNNINGEIDNGYIICFFRRITYHKEKFSDGKEANLYFKRLNDELDILFKNGKLKKKSGFSIVFINMPNFEEIKKIPKSLVDTIKYTSTYKNVKSYSLKDINELKNVRYSIKYKAYDVFYNDYENAENMIQKNIPKCEIVRMIYKNLTIVFSFIGLFIYIKNIKKKDKLNLLIHIILIIYLFILFGVVYTHVTAFNAIIYRYLSNIYILQNLFILLNLYRIKYKEN